MAASLLGLLASHCAGKVSSSRPTAGPGAGGPSSGGAGELGGAGDAGGTANTGGVATGGEDGGTGAQSGGGGSAGVPVDACVCPSEALCPTIEHLRGDACSTLESGSWVARIQYDNCDLDAFEFGSAEHLGRFYYDAIGTLVGRMMGDAFNGFSTRCGVYCTTAASSVCTQCGTDTSYPRCEP